MAPQRKNENSKKTLRDPNLFLPAAPFPEAENGNWTVPGGALDDLNDGWDDASEQQRPAENPRDGWDGSPLQKSKEDLERDQAALEAVNMEEKLEGWPWADGSREPVSIVSFARSS
jgi:hypothetical protein